jgi:hypothetical protein
MNYRRPLPDWSRLHINVIQYYWQNLVRLTLPHLARQVKVAALPKLGLDLYLAAHEVDQPPGYQ